MPPLKSREIVKKFEKVFSTHIERVLRVVRSIRLLGWDVKGLRGLFAFF